MQGSRVEARVSGSLAGLVPNTGDGPCAVMGRFAGEEPECLDCGNRQDLGRPKGIGFGSGCRIRLSGRTSSSSSDCLRDFLATSLSPRQRRLDVLFPSFFPSFPRLFLTLTPFFVQISLVRTSHSRIWRSSKVRRSVFLADGVQRKGFV